MARKFWLNLGQVLLVGLGMVVGAFAAKRAAGFGWWVMTGPALMAISIVCADLFSAGLSNPKNQEE